MQNTAKVSLPLYNKIQQQAQAQHKAHPLQPLQTTQQRSSILYLMPDYRFFVNYPRR